MNSEELNPERQNAINNSIDSSDRQVIDSFVRRHQETTEALVNTFTYFTMDNVMKAESKKENSALTPVTVKSEKTEKLSKEDLNATDITEDKIDTKTDEDGIEEEILEEGTKSGAMTKSARSVHANVHHPQRKFGNFVDEADSDDNDDDNSVEDQPEVGGGYCASFSQSEQDGSRQGEVTPSETSYSRKVESLSHTAQQATECDLSVLVDEQYEPDEDDSAEEEGFPLNPGEIEDLSEQVTCLQITTTRNSSEGITSEVKDSMEEVCKDEVEPFKLDENFDYDNVKLTPKFTAEELEYLKSFVPTNSNQT